MSYESDKFKLWQKELRAAVDSNDVETFKKFYHKWRNLGMYEEILPDDDMLIKLTIQKIKDMMI